MAITIDRVAEAKKYPGHDNFGQVEPNHLSAQYSGEIYAQLPANSDIHTLEQGMFVKYDTAAGELNYTGKGAWMLVYNEEKLYDERKQMHRDFALVDTNFDDKKLYSRVYRMHEGDIYTTTMVKKEALNVGDLMVVGAAGVLEKTATEITSLKGLVLEVAKETIMPDGHPAVKLRVVQE